ncbi:MAG: lipid-binding SYLF domain-containing protein, partial [Synergistota bacterium]|nr:lipid-binding SYLF domain-containing protein [Synergistota bacterium]
FVNITGASWGLQIGVQSIALVLVITNDRGMQGFMGNNVKLSGDLSVAAGPVGRHAEAGTDYKLSASIYSYTMSKGLFAGISLEGSVVDVDEEVNSSYWGAAISARTALDKPARDSRIQPVLREIEKLMSLGKE